MEEQDNNGFAGTISFEDFLKQIEDPAQWVLFLGDDISCRKQEQRREDIFKPVINLENSGETGTSFWSALCQAAKQEDIMELSDILFGNIWDGSSFLGEKEEICRERRNAYADALAKKEEIDLHDADEKWKKMLKLFRYMVITTCQDETIEAYLEYEQSMPVDEMVCTPYIMTTSSTWDRWIKKENGDLLRLYSGEKNMLENVPVLVKLYGSRNMPHRLLLSKEDMEQYYPVQEDSTTELPLTAAFLKIIFETKNILFIGVNFEKNHVFPLTEGIKKFLEASPGDRKRYVFHEERLSPDTKKKYHIDTILDLGNFTEPNISQQEQTSQQIDQSELTTADILEHFGKNYIRRPLKGIFPDESESSIDRLMNKELKLLKKDILKLPEEYEKVELQQDCRPARKWNRSSIRKLAIAANNLADFYDLKKVFLESSALLEGMEEKSPYDFYETVTGKILNDRLSDKSRCLHQILEKYEKGFPLGFLKLLSEGGNNEDELREWKRAGIQLTNSGIYFNLNYRKNVQKRLSYADNVMQTAGKYPKDKRKLFEYKLNETCSKSLNSFFYPVENVIEKVVTDEDLNRYFYHLFVNLGNILKEKTKEYKQVHSLLQTETMTLFKIAKNYPDPDLEWKPSLYYGLLLDSRMFPKKSHDGKALVEDEIKEILEEPENQNSSQDTSDQKRWKGLIKLHLANIIIRSRSLVKEEEYEEAIEQCVNTEDWIKRYESLVTAGMSKWLFFYKMQLLFVKHKIYMRRYEVLEMEIYHIRSVRQANNGQDLEKLQKVEEKIKENLDTMKQELIKMEHRSGYISREFQAQYDQFQGIYYYKCFLKKVRDKEQSGMQISFFEKSQRYYESAFNYYNN